MMPSPAVDVAAATSLSRLWPRLISYLPDAACRADFESRLNQHFPTLFGLLYQLYGQHYDFFYHLEQTLITAAKMATARSPELRRLDAQREQDPVWFRSEQMMGAMGYVDKFAGTLAGIRERIPYLQELGITYLHLMPLFRTPAEHNDGGYAVSSYRDVQPALGTTEELRVLAADLCAHNINLVLDFVFNHTSNEHEWAVHALQGNERYQDFFLMFDDRTLPDQYEHHLREIFPEQAPGNFTYYPGIGKWVWTTFHQYQWDLNYKNPEVFTAMLEEMLFIANLGVQVLRLDAVAFIWKELGTSCEGLPQAHLIIQAYNALARIAAPALTFKSEAIVHPAEVARYVSPQEAPLSYNPTLMALMWEAMATRQVKLLQLSMQRHFALPPGCTWINYVRCHDDIGWTFADEDALELGIAGFDHRQFLSQFYTGRFEGSFACGLPFNYNPITHDMRISGMGASLAGLEQALVLDDPVYREHALRRIELMHAIILSVGGIPLLYLGDEIAMLSDYSFQESAVHANDSRCAHRVVFDWERAGLRHDPDTVPSRIFQTLRHLIMIRKSYSIFANGMTDFFDTHNLHVLAFARNRRLYIFANFSELPQMLSLPWLPTRMTDLVTGERLVNCDGFTLDAYRFKWLLAD